MTFSLYLTSSRAKLGLTQAVLTKQLKIPLSTYKKWEGNKNKPHSRIQTQIKAEIEVLLSVVPKHL